MGPALVVLLLAALAVGDAYHVRGDVVGDTLADDGFVVLDEGFVGRYGDPLTYQKERVNEGAARTPTYSRDEESVYPRQNCSAMVGPIDSRYYCHGPEYGYCDRRSGTCFCNKGYQGVDCHDCDPTHYRLGDLCYPKLLCPNDCSGGGECDYATGTCECNEYRLGDDCSELRCQAFEPLCRTCESDRCLSCVGGYTLIDGVCVSCTVFDPRCTDCDEERCLSCGDPLLTSNRRSGQRDIDPELPSDELWRELALEVPFGSQNTDVFIDAEPFHLVGHTNLSRPLRCQQGRRLDAAWDCEEYTTSHVVCGHPGSFGFASPTYTTWEEEPFFLPITVRRTGGGVGDVEIDYELHHLTTNSSDVKPTAHYTSSQRLVFEHGVTERTFFVQLLEDSEMEESETFELRLREPSGQAVLGPQHTTVVTITENDGNATSAELSYAYSVPTDAGTASRETTFFIQSVQQSGRAQQQQQHGQEQYTAQLWRSSSQVGSEYESGMLLLPGSVSGGDSSNGTYSVSLHPMRAGDYQLALELASPNGLHADYFDNAWFDGEPVVSRVDPVVNFTWGTGRLTEYGTDNVAVRWTGKVLADHSELYTWLFETDDRVRMWIDRHLVIDRWDPDQERNDGVHLMTAGRLHDVTIEFRERVGDAHAFLKWSSPSTGGGSPVLVTQEYLFQARHIADSPLPYSVSSDVTNATRTFATGQGLSAATAGEVAEFVIHPRDLVGNARNATSRFDWFEAKLVLDEDTSGGGQGSPEFSAVIAFDSDALVWRAQYVPTISGTYWMSVWLVDNGADADEYQHVFGSPFKVTCVQAATLPARSTRWIYELGLVGDPFVMTIETHDLYGNVRPVGGDEVAMVMRHADQTGVHLYGEVTDFGNATYHGVAVPTVAGSYEVMMTVNGQIAGYNPVRANFSNIDAYALSCKAFGDGLAYGIVDVPSTFVVHTYDKYGNPMPEGFDVIASVVYSDREETGSVLDYLNGTYLISYTPKVAGDFKLNVTLAGDHIYGSPFDLHVDPGSADEDECTAMGDGLVAAVAGEYAYATVSVRDKQGNDHVDENAAVAVALVSDATFETIEGWATYVQGNQYLASYRVNVTGNYQLFIDVDGEAIVGSPFDVYVAPSEVDEDESKLDYGRGLVGGYVNNEFEIVLRSRDFFGNLLTGGGDPWTLWLEDDDEIVSSTKTDVGNGTYVFYYTPTVAGTYRIRCTLERPGGLQGDYFYASDLTALTATVVDPTIDFDWGLHMPFYEEGNPIPQDYFSVRWSGHVKADHDEIYTFYLPSDGGVRLFVNGETVIDAWESTDTDKTGVAARMTAGELVSIVVEYRHFSRESHISLQWSAPSVERETIPESHLFRVVSMADLALFGPTFLPTRLDPAVSEAEGDGLTAAATGVEASFTIISRDLYGNHKLEGGLAAYAVARDASGHEIVCDVEDLGDGEYLATYTPTVPGRYSLSVTLGADIPHGDVGLFERQQAMALNHVSGSPFNLVVVNGVATALSTAYGTGLQSATAGSLAEFWIQARDSNANARSSVDEDSFSVSISGVSVSVSVSVSGSGSSSGLLYASYTPTLAGTYDVSVTLPDSGEHIVGSPFALEVSPSETVALKVYASGSALGAPVVGAENLLVLAAHDEFGNARLQGGDQLFVKATGAEELRVLALDGGDGNYTASLVPTVAGKMLIVAELCGTPGYLTTERFSTQSQLGLPFATALTADGSVTVASGGTPELVRASGFLVPEYSEDYALTLEVDSGVTTARLFVQDALVIDYDPSMALDELEATVALVAGQAHELRLLVWSEGGSAEAAVRWVSDRQSGGVLPSWALWGSSEGIYGSPWFVTSS